MKTTQFLVATLIALFALPAAAAPEPTKNPFLWVVEKEGHTPSFLYGTMHVPDDRVLALPDVVEQALDRCDAFYAELDMAPANMMKQQKIMMIPNGQPGLSKILPQETKDKVQKVLKKYGFPMAMLDRLQPWALAMQLQSMDFLKDMLAGKKPLDMALFERCKNAGKEVGGVEIVEEQVGVFSDLTQEESILFLDQSAEMMLMDKGDGKGLIEQMIEAYVSGDMDKLIALMDESSGADNEEELSPEMKALNEKVEAKLLVDRNHRMAERMTKHMTENPDRCYYFAVGTAHYPGDEGVLKLLEKEGFTIRRLKAGDTLPGAEPVEAAPSSGGKTRKF